MATAYTNAGGSGFRPTVVSLTSSGFTWHTGSLPALLLNGINNAGLLYWDAFTVSGSTWIVFDFLYPAIIDEAKWYQSVDSAQGTWQWQGSNDGSTWTDIGSSFTLGSPATQTQTQLNGNTTAYRYYRLLGVSGSATTTPYAREIEFKITYNATGVTPSYGNGVGNRTSIITVTTDLTLYGAAPITNLVNGVYTADTLSFTTQTASGHYIKFDFGSGANKLITEANFVQSLTTSHGTWQWQGSNDNTNWTDIGSSFTLGGATAQIQTQLHGNTTGYRYYRLYGVSGSTSVTPYIYEIDFLIGDAFLTRDLTTTVAAASAVSAPIAAITRPLASSPAAVSAVAAPILAVTRALQESVAAGSATSTPSLLTLRALISAISGVSDVSTPNLAVERPLSSSLAAVSAVTTPSLSVKRALASLAAVMSETPDIELLLHGILDLTTAIATQSQVSIPALNVARPLDSSLAGQTQTSDVALAVLRALAATIAAETQTPNITLKVLRDLLTAASAQSSASTPALETICSLITAAHAVTDTSVGTLAVLRDLVVAVAVQSSLSEFALAMGVPRDLVTAIVALTQTSDIEVILAFHESLRTRGKRFSGTPPASDLRVKAQAWIKEEEVKAA